MCANLLQQKQGIMNHINIYWLYTLFYDQWEIIKILRKVLDMQFRNNFIVSIKKKLDQQ